LSKKEKKKDPDPPDDEGDEDDSTSESDDEDEEDDGKKRKKKKKLTDALLVDLLIKMRIITIIFLLRASPIGCRYLSHQRNNGHRTPHEG
jgi:hypothetical protein